MLVANRPLLEHAALQPARVPVVRRAKLSANGRGAQAMTDQRTAEMIHAAVMAERQRCYDIVLESPFLVQGRATGKAVAFDCMARIRSGESPKVFCDVRLCEARASGEVGK